MTNINPKDWTEKDKARLFEAIEAGIARSMPHTESLMMAIRDGLADGFGNMLRTATDMPGHDFYDIMEKAIREGVENHDIRSAVYDAFDDNDIAGAVKSGITDAMKSKGSD